MRKIHLFLFVFASIHLTAREGVKITRSDASSVTMEVTFDEVKKQSVTINGQTYYKLYSNHCVPVLTAGFPEVLRDALSLAVPEGAQPVIEVVSQQFQDLANVPVAPSKGSLTRNINPDEVPYVFGEMYTKNAFYPAQICDIGNLYQFRSQQGISLNFYPVQANPVSQSIRVYSKMEIKVTFLSKAGRKLKLTAPVVYSNEERNLMQHRFENMPLDLAANARVQYTPLSEFGSMLVITAPQFLNSMQPFVNWKNQKGIRTQMVTTAITGSAQASIQTYIQNYYASNPSLLYVLLVGDHEQIPAFNAGNTGSETKWSDSKYAMLAGNDWYPEVMIGRFSSANGQEITTMVNRTLEYEKNPTIGNWWGKGIGIGSDEGAGVGDDGEADWQHMRNLGNKLLAGAGYNQFHELYDNTHGGNDAPGDPTDLMVSAAVNTGAGIFLYSGHGSQNTCVTSNFNIGDINACTNYGKYPFSLQVACNNGTFNGGTCFSEAFIRAAGAGTLGPRGAIASCGSSILMAWAEPMQTQDEIGDIISNQYPNLKCYSLGSLFYNGQMSMLDNYPTATGKEVMETWVMFGDPSCLFRSAAPTPIVASHATCINPGAVSFVVNTTAGPATYVSVSQGNVTLGTASVTAAQTTVLFTQPFNSSQSIDVVVTEYNKVPYVQNVPVCVTTGLTETTASADILIDAVCKESLTVRFSGNTSGNEAMVSVYDLQGKIIHSQLVPAGGVQQIASSDWAPSVYVVKMTVNNEVVKVGKVVKQ